MTAASYQSPLKTRHTARPESSNALPASDMSGAEVSNRSTTDRSSGLPAAAMSLRIAVGSCTPTYRPAPRFSS